MRALGEPSHRDTSNSDEYQDNDEDNDENDDDVDDDDDELAVVVAVAVAVAVDDGGLLCSTLATQWNSDHCSSRPPERAPSPVTKESTSSPTPTGGKKGRIVLRDF